MAQYYVQRKSLDQKSSSNSSTRTVQLKHNNVASIIQMAKANPNMLTPNDVMVLQKTIGNGAACQLINGSRDKQKDEKPLQMKNENNTGLPDNLKDGVENLSGLSMDDVKVHYNSPKPSGVGALAYTQGTDIHVAPGQERYLPHEAWHVVQQAQGKVRPTIQMKGVAVNDDVGLEREADEMGEKVIQNISNNLSIAALEPENRALTDAFSRKNENLNSLSTATTPSIQPIQRIISVAGFQASTPATLFHGRGPNIRALDNALDTYTNARTIDNANALLIACNGYLGNVHQPARIAAAMELRAEAQAEHQLLTQIGNANAHLLDGLIVQVGGIAAPEFNHLVQIATQVGAANANVLPTLINLVTPAQIDVLAVSGAIAAIGAANVNLLIQLIPISNGVAGLGNLVALINASGAANIPLLVPIIPLIGGSPQIPTLTAMMIARGRQLNAVSELAAVAGNDGVLFARLCGELPYFQRSAPVAAPATVVAAQAAYNNAKAVATLADKLVALDTISTQAIVAYNEATGLGVMNPILLGKVQAKIDTVGVDIGNIRGGAAITPNHIAHAKQLRAIITALNIQVTGLAGIPIPITFGPAVVNVGTAIDDLDAANNVPDITTISFDHFLTRHTANYFDFANIKPDNTQWPTIWGAGALANVGNELATVLGALFAAGQWLMPATPKAGQAVAGGTAQIAGLLDGAGPGLRLGQFFPEAGASFLDHNQATMHAIEQLV